MAISRRTFQSAGQISQHSIPGAYSRIDSVKGSSGLVSSSNGVIMGQSTGGQPAVLLAFGSAPEAINVLKGGPLLEAVNLAFNGSADGLVPSTVYAMRVDSALQSSLDLKDGGSNNQIKLTSLDYGLAQNQINVVITAGTTAGKKVTITYQSDVETFDNVAQTSLTITHASATVTVTNNATTHNMVLSVGPITIDFGTYKTIADVATFINNQSGYSAVVTAGQENAPSTQLDGVSAQSLVGGYAATSSMYAIVNTINAQSQLVSAVAENGATTITVPANLATTYLTSGTDGTYTSTEWTAALLVLEAEDLQFISTPDSTQSVQLSIAAHCASMNSVTNRKERQFLVGGTWGDTTSTAKTNAAALNSKYGLYVFNGVQQYNVSGVLTNFDASYVSAILLGIACASAINAPLTFKNLNVVALEQKLTNTQLDDLIVNGVCPMSYSPGGVARVVRQVNTYQTDDLKWNEFSMVREMFFISRDLRNNLESMFVGQAGYNVASGVIGGAVKGKLAQYAQLGLFVADSSGMSWWNVIVNIAGDTVYIDFDANLTAPVNFLFVTEHFHELVTQAAA